MRKTFNEQQGYYATAAARALAPLEPEPSGAAAPSIEECFRLWHREITPIRNEYMPLRPLTPEEVTDVSIATVRESSRHRRWPKDVVESFLSAAVIREPGGGGAVRADNSSLISKVLGAAEGRIPPTSALIR